MKKAIVALAVAFLASTAMAAIDNSAHDLADDTGALISSCQFCHTPHNSNATTATGTISGVAYSANYAQFPLWNRNQPSQAYVFYTQVSGAVSIGAGSFACLSCHDGSSDMGDTYRGSNGFAAARTIASVAAYTYANVGLNLQDDHPVGVTYAEGGQYALINNISNLVKIYASNKIECGSCHDPHGTAAAGGGSDHGAGGASFLRVNANAICSTCHLK